MSRGLVDLTRQPSAGFKNECAVANFSFGFYLISGREFEILFVRIRALLQKTAQPTIENSPPIYRWDK